MLAINYAHICELKLNKRAKTNMSKRNVGVEGKRGRGIGAAFC